MEWYKFEKEVGVKLDAKADERDHKHYFRHGFNNVEVILDFSVCHSHKAVDSKQLKIFPPQHHKLIAKKYNQKLTVLWGKVLNDSNNEKE